MEFIYHRKASAKAADHVAGALQEGPLDDRLAQELLAERPHNKLALLYLGASAKEAGRLVEAEQYFWRMVNSHPYFGPAYGAIAEIASGDTERLDLAAGLSDLLMGYLQLARDHETRFAVDDEAFESAQELDRKIKRSAAGEVMSVRTTLRPYRLIYEMLAAAPTGLSAESVRQIVGCGQSIVPLLMGVIRGWVDEFLPVPGDAPARDALALLGEIGDPAALGMCLQLSWGQSDDAEQAARWAFFRIMEKNPEASVAALRPVIAELSPNESQALADFVASLPSEHPVRVLVSILPQPLPGDPSEYIEDLLENTVFEFCEEGEWEEEDVFDGEDLEGGEDDFDEDGLSDEPAFYLDRNEPCWCGSGRKYKKCHLPDDERRHSGLPIEEKADPGERIVREMISLLPEIVSRRELTIAADKFYGPAGMGSGDDEAMFMEWLIFDHILPRRGRNVIQEYLARNRSRLSEHERAVLEQRALCPLSIYEVQNVVPGRGCALLDMLRGGAYFVHDVSTSRSLVKWDVVFTRVVPSFVEGHELAATVLSIPRSFARELAGRITRKHADSGQPWEAYLRAEGHTIRKRIYTEAQREMQDLKIVTAEGDPLEFSTAAGQTLSGEAAAAALSNSGDFVEDQSGFGWLEPLENPADEDGPRRSLGRVQFNGESLTLECSSRSRLARGKALLDKLIEGGVRWQDDKFQSLEALMAEPKSGKAKPKSVAPELERKVVAKMLEDNYKQWVDQKLPALDGKSPRECVETSEGRIRVEELLRTIENGELHRRRGGKAWYDVNNIRRELGLDVPAGG